jgi:hypothetical protein
MTWVATGKPSLADPMPNSARFSTWWLPTLDHGD